MCIRSPATSMPHLQKASPARITTTGRPSLHFTHFCSRLETWGGKREQEHRLHPSPGGFRETVACFSPQAVVREVTGGGGGRGRRTTQTTACILSKLPLWGKTRALERFQSVKASSVGSISQGLAQERQLALCGPGREKWSQWVEGTGRPTFLASL